MDEAPVLYVDQKTAVRSLSLDKDELRNLLERLQERSLAAGEIEVSRFRPKPDQNAESIETAKRNLREGFKLWLTVTGAGGPELTGGIGTVFGSPDFPDDVRSVFFDVGTPLKSRFNYAVSNKCILFLDFSRPEVLNLGRPSSWQTPNESNFHVRGSDATWVNGVFHEFTEYVRSHRSKMAWLHRHSVWDVIMFFIGLPAGLWSTARASSTIERLSSSAFIQGALYIYVVLAVALGTRVLFHYARWIWPLVEYRQPRSRALAHKAAWTSIVLGLTSKLLYDVFKKLL